MKRKVVCMFLTALQVCNMTSVAFAEEMVNVVNPKGTVLMENVTVSSDENGTACVELGNGFRLYAGEDETMGTADDLVMGFGAYPQSDATGETKDPLNWRLLDIQDGAATLISDVCVNAVFFNVDATAGVDWENSNLRSWLNSRGGESFKGDTVGFYDTAFSDEEKEKILLTHVRMDYSDWPEWDISLNPDEYHDTHGTFPIYNKLKDYAADHDTTGMSQEDIFKANTDYAWDLLTTTGTETDDYVYAISGEEVFAYFGECDRSRYEGWPEHQLVNYTNGYFNCTEYALAQGAKINGGSQPNFYYFADTWTRSPGFVKEDGTCTGVSFATNGDINAGRDVNVVQDDVTYGTLPMIRVSLNS